MVLDGHRKVPKSRWKDGSSKTANEYTTQSEKQTNQDTDPPKKHRGRTKGKEKNNDTNNENETGKQDENAEMPASGGSNNSPSLTNFLEQQNRCAKTLKKLCDMAGVILVNAPGEGEAECARMVADGEADYVFSSDSDVFVYGARKVIRYVNKGTKWSTPAATPMSSITAATRNENGNENNEVTLGNSSLSKATKYNSMPSFPSSSRVAASRMTSFAEIPNLEANASEIFEIPGSYGKNRYVCVVDIPETCTSLHRDSFIMFALLCGGDYDQGPAAVGKAYAQELCFPADRFATRFLDVYRDNRVQQTNFKFTRLTRSRRKTADDEEFLGHKTTFTAGQQIRLDQIKQSIVEQLHTNSLGYFKKKFSKNHSPQQFLDSFSPDLVIVNTYLDPLVNAHKHDAKEIRSSALSPLNGKRLLDLSDMFNFMNVKLGSKNAARFTNVVIPAIVPFVGTLDKRIMTIVSKVTRKKKNEINGVSSSVDMFVSSTKCFNFYNVRITPLELVNRYTDLMAFIPDADVSLPKKIIGTLLYDNDITEIFEDFKKELKFVIPGWILKQMKYDYIGEFEQEERERREREVKEKNKRERVAKKSRSFAGKTNSGSGIRSMTISFPTMKEVAEQSKKEEEERNKAIEMALEEERDDERRYGKDLPDEEVLAGLEKDKNDINNPLELDLDLDLTSDSDLDWNEILQGSSKKNTPGSARKLVAGSTSKPSNPVSLTRKPRDSFRPIGIQRTNYYTNPPTRVFTRVADLSTPSALNPTGTRQLTTKPPSTTSTAALPKHRDDDDDVIFTRISRNPFGVSPKKEKGTDGIGITPTDSFESRLARLQSKSMHTPSSSTQQSKYAPNPKSGQATVYKPIAPKTAPPSPAPASAPTTIFPSSARPASARPADRSDTLVRLSKIQRERISDGGSGSVLKKPKYSHEYESSRNSDSSSSSTIRKSTIVTSTTTSSSTANSTAEKGKGKETVASKESNSSQYTTRVSYGYSSKVDTTKETISESNENTNKETNGDGVGNMSGVDSDFFDDSFFHSDKNEKGKEDDDEENSDTDKYKNNSKDDNDKGIDKKENKSNGASANNKNDNDDNDDLSSPPHRYLSDSSEPIIMESRAVQKMLTSSTRLKVEPTSPTTPSSSSKSTTVSKPRPKMRQVLSRQVVTTTTIVKTVVTTYEAENDGEPPTVEVAVVENMTTSKIEDDESI